MSKEKAGKTYFDRLIIDRINTFDPQPDPKEQKHWLLTPRPCVMPLGRPIIRVSMRSSENLRLVQYTVGSNRNRKAAFGKLAHKGSISANESTGSEERADDEPNSTCGYAGAKPLPNVRSKLLTRQSHSMDAERSFRCWRVKEPRQNLYICCIIRRLDWVWGTPPVWKRDYENLQICDRKV